MNIDKSITWEHRISNCELCNKDTRDLEKGPPFTNSIYVKEIGVNGGIFVCIECNDKMKKAEAN